MSKFLRPLFLTGPSGVEKGTLIETIRKRNPEKFGFAVSYTTRKPRLNEIDGIHYHFVTVDKMKKEIDEGKFIESCEVHGNFYGHSTDSITSVIKEGKCCIVDIDVQGAEKVFYNKKVLGIDPLFVFIAPPSLEELEKRLRGRAMDDEKSILRRLENAKKEIEFGEKQFKNIFDFIVVNQKLEDTVANLEDILKKHIFIL